MIKSSYNPIEKIISNIKNNSTLRNGALFTFFSFLNNGVNFFLIMILAGYLSPEGYGYLNLFNTLVTIMAILIPLGCTGYIGNSYFRKKRIDFKKIITIVFSIGIICFLFFLLLILIGGFTFGHIIGLSIKIQVLSLCICFFQLFTTVNLEVWRLQEQPIKYGLYSLGLVSLNFLLTILLITQMDFDWEGRVYSQFIVGLIFCIISIYFIKKRKLLILQKINKSLLKETLVYGLPLIPHLLSSWMRQGLDRYIINFFWEASFVGLFSFALNFGNIIHMVGSAFNASNAVSTYKLLSGNTDAKEQMKKQILIMSSFFIALSILILFSSKFLILIVFPQYVDAIPFLLPICLSAIFQCIYYLYVNFLFYYKKTQVLMYITTSISILHICLSLLFTRYGILYTAYISLFSNFVICMLVFLYSQKYYPLFNKK